MRNPPISRRAALLAMGAATAPLIAACTPSSKDAGGVATPTSTPSTPPSATPTPTPRPSFPSDYKIPPLEGGLAPVITRVVTKQPVVFLTLDDGVVKDPKSLELLDKYGYPATLFLSKNAMGDNPDFFKKFRQRGDRIQNHTISHDVNMSRKAYSYELGEMTGMQEYIKAEYGEVPTLFRPPGGAYSPAMRRAVAAAGMKAIVTWECKANAGRMDYQAGNALRPGDICLMHFRKEFADDLGAFHRAQQASGLTVVRLEDFLGV